MRGAVTRAAIALACLGALGAPLPAPALSSDRDQPIELEADRAELDETRGVSVYTGDVEVIQGTMHLQGDKVTVHMQDGSPERLIAEGTPARFRQRPDGKREDVVATARELEHIVSQDLLKLRGDAVVIQGGDRFQGDRMQYNLATDRVSAETEPDSGSRVRIILQPRTRD